MATPTKGLVSRRQAVGAAILSPLLPASAQAATPPASGPAMSKDVLLAGLQAILDPDGILTGDAIGKRYLTRKQDDKPLAILRPRNAADVSAIMKLCTAARQPVVPQGGMTGLVGGGVAHHTEIVISSERMNMIDGVNTADRTMTVGAGVTLKDAQDRAATLGFMVPVDFGIRKIATIGGMISTNAGGEEVVRYGMTRESVLGLEVVLADGTIVTSLNQLIKNNAGYDLKHLFIGTEGTLGLVTRAVLRLRRRQDGAATALVAIDKPDGVPELLRHLEEELGGALTKFEIMWADYDAFVRKYCPDLKSPLGPGHTYYLVTDAVGNDAEFERERLKKVLARAKKSGVIVNAAIAKDEAERRTFWALREEAGAKFSEMGPFFGYDVSLSLADMPAFGARVKREMTAALPAVQVLILGHVGDGNMHLVVAPGTPDEEAHHKCNEIIYGAIRELHGSVSAEHGIGTEKKDYLAWSRSPEEIVLMRTLKHTLDPLGILNPGKVL